jgi:Phasin protein
MQQYIGDGLPALSDVIDMNQRFMQRTVAATQSWMQFMHRRIERDIELAQQLARCINPQDFTAVCSEYAKTYIQDYQSAFAEFARLGSSGK